MFSEWVTAGAAFGIEAFTALFVFLVLCAAVLGLLVMFGSVMGGGNDDRKTKRADRSGRANRAF